MKCTRCQVSCSDLRDICPECYLDFRPWKREAGLPITNPSLSYEELLTRAGVNMAELFDSEFEEMSSALSAMEMNLGASSLGTIIAPQEAELLFDLSYEALENPEAEKKYVEPTFTESSRTIDAATLQKELESVRERITSPLLGLKKSVNVMARRDDPEIEDPLTKRVEQYMALAARTSRLKLLGGFLLDLSFCILGSMLLTGTYLALTNFEILHPLLQGRLPEAIDIVAITSLYICVLLISLVACPLISLIFYDVTPGGRMAGLQILRIDGEILDVPRMLVRSCALPVSLLTFSYLFVVFGKRALHDAVAGTVTFAGNPLDATEL